MEVYEPNAPAFSTDLYVTIPADMDNGGRTSVSREGPFAVLSGLGAGAAILLALVTQSQPGPRLVFGGVLLGTSTAAYATWRIYSRTAPDDSPQRPPIHVVLITALCGLLVLITALCGLLVLIMPTIYPSSPGVRLVVGGLLLGISIGAYATWRRCHRTAAQEPLQRPPIVALLITASCGLFLLVAPTILGLSQESQGTDSQRGEVHQARPASPTPVSSNTASMTPATAAAGSQLSDLYLADLGSNRIEKTGALHGPGYSLTHGLAYPLSADGHGTVYDYFTIPTNYYSLTVTLKSVGAAIRFRVLDNGPIFEQTIQTSQPTVTVTCAVTGGKSVGLEADLGSTSVLDATAVWGDAKFSTAPAPTKGCS